MGTRYLVRLTVTPVAGEDVMTLVSAANRRMRPIQVAIAGVGTTSAAQRLHLCRSTGGTTGGGALTPNEAGHTDQVAAVTVVNTTWAAQPTPETHMVPLGFNALGGAIIYNVPRDALECRNGENISLRANTGVTYQAVDVSILFEED